MNKALVSFGTILLIFIGIASGSELVDKGDWTIVDASTGLMWQKLEGGKRSWEEAILFCEKLTLADHDDWRLPDINELVSLVDRTRHDPAVDRQFFPDVASSVYWSSSTSPGNTEFAWFVSFYSGNVNNYDKRYSYYVRCVRGSY